MKKLNYKVNKATRVSDTMRDPDFTRKRVNEALEGPTLYDAFPTHETFGAVSWYWDESDLRHYTNLVSIEQWYARQEYLTRATEHEGVDILDTNGNEPIQSNMEGQLKRLDLFGVKSEQHMEFLVKHLEGSVQGDTFRSEQFTVQWDVIQKEKLEKEITEVLLWQQKQGLHLISDNPTDRELIQGSVYYGKIIKPDKDGKYNKG